MTVAMAALRSGGVAEWRIEAEVLLRHALGMDRAEFLVSLIDPGVRFSDAQSRQLRALLNRRLAGEPLAYIVGYREFYGLELAVNDDTLIPRQETELLVGLALESIARATSDDRNRTPLLADVGTGSGAVALAIAAHADKEADIVATDISTGALDVAERNALKLGLSDRIEFVHGDMLSPVHGPIDVIVSNPPYIPSGEIAGLAVEVRREPRVALDGGADGLEPLRKLLAQAKGKLASGGVIIVELMPEQMSAAKTLAVETMRGGVEVSARKDLMGSERALVIECSAARDGATDGRNADAR